MKRPGRYLPYIIMFCFSLGEEYSQQAELNGEDYEKVKMLETSAIELEKRERKKKKKNPDTGFAGESYHISFLFATSVVVLCRLCSGPTSTV